MDATTLYIIGNRFDRHHGLPTLYQDFKAFLEVVDQGTHEWVETYVPVKEDWSDLELALAHLDTDNIISDMACHLGSYSDDDWSDASHHAFQYEVGQVAAGLSKTLQSRFAEWIRSIEIPDRSTIEGILKTLNPIAAFLTFNYTSTLTKLYDVAAENILHIHGESSDPDSKLVLGHVWSPEVRPLLYDSVDGESADHRLMEALATLDEYFSATFKPSDQIIQHNAGFFEGLKSIEQVIVLGHSLSPVDGAYFLRVVEALAGRPARWMLALRKSLYGRLPELNR